MTVVPLCLPISPPRHILLKNNKAASALLYVSHYTLFLDNVK
jgi:hypothetical protein